MATRSASEAFGAGSLNVDNPHNINQEDESVPAAVQHDDLNNAMMSIIPYDHTQAQVLAPVPLNSARPRRQRQGKAFSKSYIIQTPQWKTALKLQTSLGPGQQNLSCLLFMQRTNVTGGASLVIPDSFSKFNMPQKDCQVILEVVQGGDHMTALSVKYLAGTNRLRGGWKKFSNHHGLRQEDVLIFHLVENKADSIRMEVYIVRKDDRVDRVASIPEGSGGQSVNSEETVSDDFVEEQKEAGSPGLCTPGGNGTDIAESSILRGLQRYKDFHIVFNGSAIDAEFSRNMRVKYYELCRSQNMFLHEHLRPSICTKFAAGAITETVHIADGIRTASPSTPREDVEAWMENLETVERLGMSVGFLRERLTHQSMPRL